MKVEIYGHDDWRTHYTTMNTTAGNGINENLTERSEKFSKSIYKYVYRIPLKYLCDAGLVNQCFKLNTKYPLTLETGMQKLFKTNTNQRADDLPRSGRYSLYLSTLHHAWTIQIGR